jgi:hypothetical protein
MKADGPRHCQTGHAADAPIQPLSRRAMAPSLQQSQKWEDGWPEQKHGSSLSVRFSPI